MASDPVMLSPDDEWVRLAYLNALGIMQYCPNDAVAMGGVRLPSWEPNFEPQPQPSAPQPVAAVPITPQAELPGSAVAVAVAAAVDAATDTTATTPTPDPALAALQALESGADIRLDPSRILGGEQAQSGARLRRERPSAMVSAFTLLFISTEHYLLAVECGVADAPGLSSLESRWISDLLRALGASEPEVALTRARHFRWPVLNTAFGADDLGAAGEALLSFLEGSGCEQPLVIIGAPAGILVDVERGQPGQLAALNAVPCLQTESLRAMQADVACKRAVWQQLCRFLDR